MLTLRLFRLEMKSGLPFTSTVKATTSFLSWQSVGVPDAAPPAAEAGLLREGISSLTDSTIDRLTFCEAMMKNPGGQTQKIYFMLKMLKRAHRNSSPAVRRKRHGTSTGEPQRSRCCYRPGDRKKVIPQAGRFRILNE
jgi:hypothetical protein